MKNKLLILVSTVLLLFSVLPTTLAQAVDVTTQLTDGEYEIAIEVLKDKTDEISATSQYLDSKAKIKVENGKTYAVVTLKSSAWWQSLKTQTTQPGSFDDNNFVEAELVSKNEAENTRVVKFEVPDLNQVLNAKIHIIVTGVPGVGEYDSSYDIRLKFGVNDIVKATDTTKEESTTVPALAQLQDGEYTIQFKTLHEKEDKDSSMARYIEAPATLTVENGKNIVLFTLTNNEQITAFQTEQNGELVDADVVSVDEEKNTRTVSFEVVDLTQIMNAKVQIYVAAQNYTGNHMIRIAFDSNSILAHTASEPLDAVLKDGEYTIQFKALHEKEDKDSSMTRYIQAPATLTVENGKNIVLFTLTNNEQITAFQTEQNGELVDADVVSVDEEKNTRTVSFEVADLTAIMNAKVQVYVAAQNYTGNHVIRLAFDSNSILAQTAPKSFDDIQASWAKQYIESLAAKDIIKGVSESRFAPENQLTRAEFTVLLSRALDLPKQPYAGIFSDVTEKMEWAVYEVEAVNRAGIVLGNNGKFSPNEHIDREQMVTMIVRAIEYKNSSVLEGVDRKVTLTDEASIQAYAKEYVGLAVGLGIVDGITVNGESVFAPKQKASRAQAAKIVYYLLESLK